MEYGKVLKRAWEITWRHRVLWIFGVVATIFGAGNQPGGGGGSGLQYAFRGLDMENLWRVLPFFGRVPFSPDALPGFQVVGPFILALLGFAFMMGLVFLIVGILVRYTSFGAMIDLVNTAEVCDDEGVTFQRGLRTGWRRFLPLFAIDILISIATFVLVTILVVLFVVGVLLAVLPAIPFFRAGNLLVLVGILWAVGVGLFVVLFLLFLGLAISAFTTVLRMFAFRASVIEEQNVFDALGRSFTLLRARLWASLVTWVLLALINVVLSVVMIPVVLVGIGGMIGPMLAVLRLTRSVFGAILVAFPAMLGMALISLFIGGLYLVFRSTMWTLAFRALREGVPEEA